MSRLHDKLIEHYAEHYARVNVEIDPSQREDHFSSLKATYGDLVRSLPAGSRLLDLGCGTGLALRWFARQPGIAAMGVDSSPSQVAVAHRALPDVDVVCEDGLSFLRRHPNTFNAIFCFDVLEHIPGDDLCLEWVEAARAALVGGGFFVCRMPNAANLTGAYGRYIDLTHQRAFTSTTIIQLLEAADLADCRIVPIRASHFSGRARLFLEHWLHRAVFYICGRGLERVFTSNVCAVGYKR